MRLNNQIVIRTIIIFGLTLLVVSCKNKENNVLKDVEVSNKNYSKIDSLQWLVGNWTNISSESQSYENWIQENDSTMTGFSYTTVEKDTVFSETVNLQQVGDEAFLIVRVPDQNESEAVTFKLLPTRDAVFTFENKNHDFPQRISYTNPIKDSIHAWIEGNIDGKSRKVDFKFKRSN